MTGPPGAQRFGCPTCGKSYTSLGSLRKHMHVHGEKSFACTFPGCNKRFADAAKLESHAVKHTASKDIKCDACGKVRMLHLDMLHLLCWRSMVKL
jgi:uncharacterized Zn-finger protein